MQRALVLAGGGVAGIAWELGVLLGLTEADPTLGAWLEADLVVGTSAGSSVGAQLDPRSPEIPVDIALETLVAELQAATAGTTSLADVRRRICAFALAADTVPENDRRAVMAARLPRHEWPGRDLKVAAVDALTGERVVFTRDSGVGLVDAVAASCAVPGVWPPMTIGGRGYVDGGVWSGANADLAAGADEVRVLTPTLPDAPTMLGRPLGDELAELGEHGSVRVHVIHADDPASRRSAPTRWMRAPGRRRLGLGGRPVARPRRGWPQRAAPRRG